MANDKVIYTVLLGDYDALIEPEYVTPGWDYVCFTNNPNFKSNVWQPRELPIEGDEVVLTTRCPKLMPHKYFGEHYNFCLYIDGNIVISSNLDEFLEVALPDGYDMATFAHPTWNCVYHEADAIIRIGKAEAGKTQTQIAQYAREGLPHNVGMLCAYLLVWRRHNINVQKHSELWFGEFSHPDKIRRDQISFNYLLWKHQLVKVNFMDLNEMMNSYFKWLPHSH